MTSFRRNRSQPGAVGLPRDARQSAAVAGDDRSRPDHLPNCRTVEKLHAWKASAAQLGFIAYVSNNKKQWLFLFLLMPYTHIETKNKQKRKLQELLYSLINYTNTHTFTLTRHIQQTFFRNTLLLHCCVPV